MRLKRETFSNIAVYIASAAVVEILFNKKVKTGIKKGYVSCRDYFKRLASEGADAYRRGRDSVNHPGAGGDKG